MAVLQKSDPVDLETTAPDSSVESEIIKYFVSFVQMLGLPKSVGQIYGTLFASEDPLSMDDIITRLGISKGSASQGLNLLRSLGAVTSHLIPGDRREHFAADLNVSRIVHHFFEERLLPRLQHGSERVDSILAELACPLRPGQGAQEMAEARQCHRPPHRSLAQKVTTRSGRGHPSEMRPVGTFRDSCRSSRSP